MPRARGVGNEADIVEEEQKSVIVRDLQMQGQCTYIRGKGKNTHFGWPRSGETADGRFHLMGSKWGEDTWQSPGFVRA
eukprot:13474831-Heterocapsa_arctica.AAC.1